MKHDPYQSLFLLISSYLGFIHSNNSIHFLSSTIYQKRTRSSANDEQTLVIVIIYHSISCLRPSWIAFQSLSCLLPSLCLSQCSMHPSSFPKSFFKLGLSFIPSSIFILCLHFALLPINSLSMICLSIPPSSLSGCSTNLHCLSLILFTNYLSVSPFCNTSSFVISFSHQIFDTLL